jgi:benzoate membrane transport protein
MRFSVVAAALVAAVVGFGGTLAIVVAAAHHLGADTGQTASFVTALCLGIAATSMFLSLRYRMPIVTAWSLAGGVLIASLPPGTALAEGIGAFLFSALLMVAAGAIPWLGRAIARLPPAIGGAMLAGLLLRFVLGLFQSAQAMPALVLPLFAVFLLARRLHPASAPLLVIAVGLPLSWALGLKLPITGLAPSGLTWMTPQFSPAALVGLGVPLFLVTMATQQVPGAAVLRVAGYRPPMRGALVVTGIATLLTAPFGGYSTNLSSVTASICTGVDAHPDPARRWMTGPVYALCYVVFAAFGASFVALFAAMPPALVAAVAGCALLSPLAGALSAALAGADRFAATVAFGVTASGMTLLGIGAAFWGLLAGVAVLAVDRLRWR